MGVDLIWRDAAGAESDAAHDDSAIVSDLIVRVREDPAKRNWLLTTIDPYGDTRFSSGQASQLFRELELLRNQSTNVEERIALGRVLSILRAAEGTTDDWLEFLGD